MLKRFLAESALEFLGLAKLIGVFIIFSVRTFHAGRSLHRFRDISGRAHSCPFFFNIYIKFVNVW